MTCEKKLISVITPFYNESESVSYFFDAMKKLMQDYQNLRFEIVCVDDGSSDATLEFLRNFVTLDDRFKVLELSRNFGKEVVLTAGIDESIGERA